MLNHADGLLKHGLLEAKEVFNVQCVTYQIRRLLVTTGSSAGGFYWHWRHGGVSVLDDGLEVEEVSEPEAVEFLPPTLQLAHHDVVGNQFDLDLLLSSHLVFVGVAEQLV